MNLLSSTSIISVVPEAINRLQKQDRARYIELMQSQEKERRYFGRIMIVGKESVGKTSLLRRLLNKRIDDVTSTDGVEIHQCKINIEDGKWTVDNLGKKHYKFQKYIVSVQLVYDGFCIVQYRFLCCVLCFVFYCFSFFSHGNVSLFFTTFCSLEFKRSSVSFSSLL